jgi:hypothetical protein
MIDLNHEIRTDLERGFCVEHDLNLLPNMADPLLWQTPYLRLLCRSAAAFVQVIVQV